MKSIPQPCRSEQPDMIMGHFIQLCIYNVCGRGLAQASQLLQHPKMRSDESSTLALCLASKRQHPPYLTGKRAYRLDSHCKQLYPKPH